MLTVFLRSKTVCLPKVTRARLLNNKLLCLTASRTVVATYDPSEVMVYTQDAQMVQRLNDLLGRPRYIEEIPIPTFHLVHAVVRR